MFQRILLSNLSPILSWRAKLFSCRCKTIMGKEEIINIRCGYGDLLIFIGIPSLFHAAVQKDTFAAGFDIMAAAGDFMGCA